MAVLIDSYTGSTNATGLLGAGATQKGRAQAFTCNIDCILNYAEFRVKNNASATGNATAVLYALTGTYGTDAKPTGAPLATSDNVDVSGISSSATLVTFTFSGANKIDLTDGTTYCIAIQLNNGTNYITVDLTTVSASHSGNASSTNDLSTWSGSTSDLAFTVYADDPVPLEINISSSLTINEDISINNSSGFADVYDSINIVENINISLPINDIIIFDSINIVENTEINQGLLVTQDINITEDMILSISSISIDVNDSITINENIETEVLNNIVIVDNIDISEYINISIPIYISIFESINITENLDVSIPININVFDSITIIEDISYGIFIEISVFDQINITENFSQDNLILINSYDLINIIENINTEVFNNITIIDEITITETLIMESFRFSPSPIKRMGGISRQSFIGKKSSVGSPRGSIS